MERRSLTIGPRRPSIYWLERWLKGDFKPWTAKRRAYARVIPVGTRLIEKHRVGVAVVGRDGALGDERWAIIMGIAMLELEQCQQEYSVDTDHPTSPCQWMEVDFLIVASVS